MPVNSFSESPAILLTIDTEGDNLWRRPRIIETHNAKYIQRFQDLCEKFKFKPTYLVNYEMAKSEVFSEFGRQIIRNSTGEIGMHLHAWNSPPLVPVTIDDYVHQPYLIEYPESVMKSKIHYMTRLLEDVFGITIRSHRAGRWGFDERYAKMIADLGYCIDCSVTPHVDWSKNKGVPGGRGGRNYINYPEVAYYLDLTDIRRQGNSSLLELPMTIMPFYQFPDKIFNLFQYTRVGRSLHQRNITWLRPNGSNIKQIIRLVKMATHTKRDYIQFVLHSSEFMPGGSPTFRDHDSIEKLFEDLNYLFTYIRSKGYIGKTLYEYYTQFRLSNL